MKSLKSIFSHLIKHPLQMKFLFVFTFIFYGAVISFISYSILHYYQTESTKEKVQKTQKQSFTIKSENLKMKINEYEDELKSINISKIFNSYINTKTENENILDLFSVIMNKNKELSQLRFIDFNGNEKIRFQRDEIGFEPIKIQKEYLQNKSSRYYFQDIKNTAKNLIWYSNLDLNIEHGKIQIPIVPTLRIGTPVYSQNKFEGILIINIFFKDILESYVKSPFSYISICDKDGEFIIHKHLNENGILQDYSWTKYLNKDTNLDIHSQKLQNLNGNDSSEYIFNKSIYHIIPNKDKLSVYYEPKIPVLEIVEANDKSYIFTVTIIVLLLSIPLSFIISILPNMLNDELYETKKMLENEMNTIDENVYLTITDKDGIILDVSKAYLDLIGFNREDLVGKKHNMLKHPNTKESTYNDLWNTILAKKVWEGEIDNLKKNGEVFNTKILIKPNLNASGDIDTFTAYIQDITYEKEVEILSLTDDLTKLYNKREFNKVFKNYIANSKRFENPFTMMILDIDYFKQYNDTYGHLIGDNALRNISIKINELTQREGDLAFRIGGEEFAIIFSAKSLNDSSSFTQLVKDSIEGLKIEHKTSKVSEYVTVSVGLFYIDDLKSLSENDVFSMTDKALYKAKELGRNKIIAAEV